MTYRVGKASSFLQLGGSIVARHLFSHLSSYRPEKEKHRLAKETQIERVLK